VCEEEGHIYREGTLPPRLPLWFLFFSRFFSAVASFALRLGLIHESIDPFYNPDLLPVRAASMLANFRYMLTNPTTIPVLLLVLLTLLAFSRPPPPVFLLLMLLLLRV
jgi:hypothetical protein